MTDEAAEPAPIPMVLHCPKCGTQHVDEDEWATTRVHKTHLCAECGRLFRPANVPTVGVDSIPGTPLGPRFQRDLMDPGLTSRCVSATHVWELSDPVFEGATVSCSRGLATGDGEPIRVTLFHHTCLPTLTVIGHDKRDPDAGHYYQALMSLLHGRPDGTETLWNVLATVFNAGQRVGRRDTARMLQRLIAKR